jgi:hypothetical protein
MAGMVQEHRGWRSRFFCFAFSFPTPINLDVDLDDEGLETRRSREMVIISIINGGAGSRTPDTADMSRML